MTIMDYRTQDGLADYCFSIEFKPDSGWQIYVIFDESSCGKQDDGLGLPHQSVGPDGRRYVNHASKLANLGDAKTVAGVWAELAHRCQHMRTKGRSN